MSPKILQFILELLINLKNSSKHHEILIEVFLLTQNIKHSGNLQKISPLAVMSTAFGVEIEA